MLVPVIVTTFISLAAALPGTTPTPVPNGIRGCARFPCPEYTLLEDYGNGFFKRRIEPGRWLYKISPACDMDSAYENLFVDMENYFRAHSIPRTAPIVFTVNEKRPRSVFCPEESGDLTCCPRSFSMQYYIPSGIADRIFRETGESSSEYFGWSSTSNVPVTSAASTTDSLPIPAEDNPIPPSSNDNQNPLVDQESSIYLIRATEPREFYGRTILAYRPTTFDDVEYFYGRLRAFLEERNLGFSRYTYSLLCRYNGWEGPAPYRYEILIPMERGDY